MSLFLQLVCAQAEERFASSGGLGEARRGGGEEAKS